MRGNQGNVKVTKWAVGGIRFPCQSVYGKGEIIYDANGNQISLVDLNQLGERYEALRKAARALIDSADTTTVSAAALHILMEQA